MVDNRPIADGLVISRDPDAWDLGKRVSVTGGTVAFDQWGDGPPVVLVHGSPSWSYLWRRITPELARTHTVYAWDLLGYGSSFTADGVLPSIALHAATLTELAASWGLNAPALVGHDIGGATVLRATLLHHLAPSVLVLLDPVIQMPWLGGDTQHMKTHLGAYRTMPNHLFREIIAAHLSQATFKPMNAATRQAYLHFYGNAAGQQRWLDRSEGFTEADTRDIHPLLPTLDVPTQIIWGQEDSWLPVAQAHELATLIPDARVQIISDAGHFVTEDAPDAVTREIALALGTC